MKEGHGVDTEEGGGCPARQAVLAVYIPLEEQ